MVDLFRFVILRPAEKADDRKYRNETLAPVSSCKEICVRRAFKVAIPEGTSL